MDVVNLSAARMSIKFLSVAGFDVWMPVHAFTPCRRVFVLPGPSVYRRERLKFRADGTAKVKGLAVASLQQGHFFFGEEDDEKEENTEAADGGAGQAAAGREEDVVSADEKKTSRGGAGEQEETEMVGGAMLHRAEPARRQAFLERVRQKVQAVQEADKVIVRSSAGKKGAGRVVYNRLLVASCLRLKTGQEFSGAVRSRGTQIDRRTAASGTDP